MAKVYSAMTTFLYILVWPTWVGCQHKKREARVRVSVEVRSVFTVMDFFCGFIYLYINNICREKAVETDAALRE